MNRGASIHDLRTRKVVIALKKCSRFLVVTKYSLMFRRPPLAMTSSLIEERGVCCELYPVNTILNEGHLLI